MLKYYKNTITKERLPEESLEISKQGVEHSFGTGKVDLMVKNDAEKDQANHREKMPKSQIRRMTCDVSNRLWRSSMVVIMILTLLVRGAGAVVNVVEPTACLTAKTIASPLNDLKLATGRTTSYYFWVSDIFTMSSDTNSCDLSDFVCVPFYTPSDGTAAAY